GRGGGVAPPAGPRPGNPRAGGSAPVPPPPAVAADGLVVGDRTVAQGDGRAVRAVIDGPAADVEAAAPAAAAVGAGAPGAAHGLVGDQQDPGNGPRREHVHRQAAANAHAAVAAAAAEAARRAGAAGPADGGVVVDPRVAQLETRAGVRVDGSADADGAAAAGAAHAADGLVVVEGTAAHRELRPVQGEDAAAGA